ncbi:hypothetical protein DF185_09340 [Marinifilum breve]|uniref:DUF5710 domain-containing protein n=1 Tax=Marinifilum breve TaxID=2184082 RepID=A0A2V3ZZF0_9BACT|nr:DUF5710 domain-containing protein [Marinifilum breve]PXY01661.1 hypothetical protein DF185_09340 [Marinifilum breve]
MSIQIEISGNNKEEAIRRGACWDTENKLWYIPDNKRLHLFEQWLPFNALIVKSPLFFVVKQMTCPHCKQETPYIIMGAKNIMLPLKSGEYTQWVETKKGCLFSNVEYIPHAVQNLVNLNFPFFKSMNSNELKGEFMINECIHCNTPLINYYDFFNTKEIINFLLNEKNFTKSNYQLNYLYDIPLVGLYTFNQLNELEMNVEDLIIY